MGSVTFNDILAVTLLAFGFAGFFVAIVWREPMGQLLCAFVIGYAIGIYGDRAKP